MVSCREQRKLRWTARGPDLQKSEIIVLVKDMKNWKAKSVDGIPAGLKTPDEKKQKQKH